MPSIQTVIDRLNDAVRRDWMGMQRLVQERVQTTVSMVQHPTIIAKPVQTEAGTIYGMGLMGVINGLVRETNEEMPIEAVYTTEEPIELIGFALRGQQLPRDVRNLGFNELQPGGAYRVRDAVDNLWVGRVEPPRPGEDQALYLRLPNGQRAQIFYHDVKQIVSYNHPQV